MFKQLRLKLAARRVERNKKTTVATKKTGFWATLWAIVTWPFRMFARLCKWVWRWIRSIDLIGLVNLTLLVAIITLFSILIMDMYKCRKSTVVYVARDAAPVTVADQPAGKTAATAAAQKASVSRTGQPVAAVTLPLKKKVQSACETVTVNTVQVPTEYNFRGDVIIDGTVPGTRLSCGTTIKGNLYLQNMHRFNLPCNMYIDGDLFLRDVGMLRFCGEFTVTGNIYVSHNSSFGPIPRSARVGGQVIF